MGIQRYKALVSVVEEGSVSKAARKMGYTQSAVSKMLAELEKEWKLKLMFRNHDGVELTSYGKELLPEVRRLVKDYERLNYSIEALHGVTSGNIRVGAPASISANLMPGALKQFATDYPNIKVELMEGEDTYIAELLRRGEIDICVLPEALADKYDAVSLLSDPLVAIVPRDNKYAAYKKFPVRAFATQDVIRVKELLDTDIKRFLEDNDVVPNLVYEVSDVNVMLSMVEKGLGVCIGYERLVTPLRYDVVVMQIDKTRKRNLKLCVRYDEGVTPLIDVFKKSLIDYVKSS
ncbi:MAG: LysR family transcriptional regulator [Lachnospiraceae bacterium]|nr:LysR family transcriptional regulator [Lachnospiraceae bacterium]